MVGQFILSYINNFVNQYYCNWSLLSALTLVTIKPCVLNGKNGTVQLIKTQYSLHSPTEVAAGLDQTLFPALFPRSPTDHPISDSGRARYFSHHITRLPRLDLKRCSDVLWT